MSLLTRITLDFVCQTPPVSALDCSMSACVKKVRVCVCGSGSCFLYPSGDRNLKAHLKQLRLRLIAQPVSVLVAHVGFLTSPFMCVISGAPIIMSSPHFYQADDKYVQDVYGMNPRKEEHETAIDISPVRPLVCYNTCVHIHLSHQRLNYMNIINMSDVH